MTGPTLTAKDDGLLCVDQEKDDTCFKYYIDLDDDKQVMRCNSENKECVSEVNLISISIGNKALESLERKDLEDLKDENSFRLVEADGGIKSMKKGRGGTDSHTYRLITSAKIDDGPKTPALIDGFKDSAFGKKQKDWNEWKGKHSDAVIKRRKSDGSTDTAKDLKNDHPNMTLDDFYPMYIDAEDGGIVDLGNRARLKSTLIGAGAGGALGAFTAYQGAQNDIDERWVSAVREYKDSLQKFYCMTGSRFMSYYNDVVLIPNINE